MAISGRLVLIKKGGTAIAGARVNSVTVDNSPVDISDIASGGYRELANFAGNRKLDLSVSGVWQDDTLQDLAFSTTQSDLLLTDITIELDDAATTPATISGNFYFANYTADGNHDTEATFTASMQSSGAWTYATGTP